MLPSPYSTNDRIHILIVITAIYNLDSLSARMFVIVRTHLCQNWESVRKVVRVTCFDRSSLILTGVQSVKFWHFLVPYLNATITATMRSETDIEAETPFFSSFLIRQELVSSTQKSPNLQTESLHFNTYQGKNPVWRKFLLTDWRVAQRVVNCRSSSLHWCVARSKREENVNFLYVGEIFLTPKDV